MSYYIVLFIVVSICVLLITGCIPNIITPVVQKTYTVCLKMGSIVRATKPEDLIKIVNDLKIPLKIIMTALNYITDKRYEDWNLDTIKIIQTISTVVSEITVALDGITVQNIQESKDKIIEKIELVQNSVKELADRLKVQLPVVVMSYSANSVTDLLYSAYDLQYTIDRAK